MATAMIVCTRRLPLNETIDMDIEQRLMAGDLEVIYDSTREAIADLETIADRMADLLCGEPEALRRLSEVRMRQNRTGKPWHGGAITAALNNQDAGVKDHAGTEPRGPRRQQEPPRRAKAGRAAKKRSRRC
jgi:hypothetical protein